MDSSKRLGLFLALILLFLFLPSEVSEKGPSNNPKRANSELIVIQENAFLAISSPSLSDDSSPSASIRLNSKDEIKRLVKESYPDLYDIVFCESTFRPKVCSYKGCEYGMGLGGIIPSTLRYCEKKLGRELDPFDPRDNLDCCQWLLKNEGLKHWKSSEACWSQRSSSF